MKPDGTHTTEEIIEIIQNELQSWERDEICTVLLGKCSDNQLSYYFSKYTPEYIEKITGYYVYEDEREDIAVMELWEVIDKSGFTLHAFFEHIVKKISSERLSDWIAKSKLDKTILLNKLDHGFICDWLTPNPNKGKPTKIEKKQTNKRRNEYDTKKTN